MSKEIEKLKLKCNAIELNAIEELEAKLKDVDERTILLNFMNQSGFNGSMATNEEIIDYYLKNR